MLAIVLALVLVSGCTTYKQNNTAETKHYAPINAEINLLGTSYDPYGVEIINRNDYDWINLKITVNEYYIFEMDEGIKAGKNARIHFAGNFHDSEGRNLFTQMAMTDIYVDKYSIEVEAEPKKEPEPKVEAEKNISNTEATANDPTIEINLQENQTFPYNQEATIEYTVNGVTHNGKYDIHIYERLFHKTNEQMWKDSYDIGKKTGEKEENLLYSLMFTPTNDNYPTGEYTLEITIYDYLADKTITENKKLNLE